MLNDLGGYFANLGGQVVGCETTWCAFAAFAPLLFLIGAVLMVVGLAVPFFNIFGGLLVFLAAFTELLYNILELGIESTRLGLYFCMIGGLLVFISTFDFYEGRGTPTPKAALIGVPTWGDPRI